ncbi:MAG: hypothetical protein IJA69_04445 [Clostridia bacterium]|nr:hypothetical protein [Clostridia bacterium]
MKNDCSENLVCLANLFVIYLAKDQSVKQLQDYKTFFNLVSNNLNCLISDKISRKTH